LWIFVEAALNYQQTSAKPKNVVHDNHFSAMDPNLNAPETEKTQMDSETEVTTAIATEAEEGHSEQAEAIITKKLCGVCNNQEPKYKCTRCALPL